MMRNPACAAMAGLLIVTPIMAYPADSMEPHGVAAKDTNTAGTVTFTGSLFDTGCFPSKAEGSWGFCGPASCSAAYITCPDEGGGPTTVDGVTGTYINQQGTQYTAETCVPFLERTTNADLTDFTPKGRCDSSCTQRTDGVCSASFLANVLVGSGVKYAYCNDKWLVVSSTGEPSVFTANLDDVPFPPANSDNTARTGMMTLDTTRMEALYYPLDVTDLEASSPSNNLDAYDAETYLVDGSSVYGLPADAGTGTAVNGQMIFPIYNNNAQYTPAKCEVDSCNEHVGQGGGMPHLHGDPFADGVSHTCLYSPSNYSSYEAHPPIIGFAYDGHLIYGRHLSTDAPGYASPLLDDCGGHYHDDVDDVDEHGTNLHTTYHYHTQVFDASCSDGDVCETGDTYAATTTGPYQCYKADLSAQEGSSALLTMSSQYATSQEMSHFCCEMSDYYLLTGVTLDQDAVSAESTCEVPSIDHGTYDLGSCSAGGTMYSGWQCTPTCEDGYDLTGTTICVGGILTAVASCTASSGGSTSPLPPPPSSSSSPSAPPPVALCASGTDDTGKNCPPDDTNGACPPGCELTTPPPPLPPPPPPPSGTCKSWCPNNANSWDKKCNWTKCEGCADCTETRLKARKAGHYTSVLQP